MTLTFDLDLDKVEVHCVQK